MSDLREAMALVIDDGVRQALRDYDISDETMRGDPELLPSALLTADAALAAIEAAGFAVVPREATRDIRAAMRSAEKVPQTVDEAWANILAAAPKP